MRDAPTVLQAIFLGLELHHVPSVLLAKTAPTKHRMSQACLIVLLEHTAQKGMLDVPTALQVT
jgi:hypothetical protein